MRTLLLVASVLLFSPALAQDCANDYSGTQITDGFNYEIAYETDLARNSLDFLNGPQTGSISTRMAGICRMI